MIKPRFKYLLAALGLLSSTSSAALLGYTERSLKYPAEQGWEDNLKLHWARWKELFLDGGKVKATDPSGSAGGIQNVSEAQGYALLLSIWFNDTTTFQKVWASTESNFWNSSCGTYGYYAWKLPWSGCSGQGSYAPDADQDIAGALIFASALADSGKWPVITVNGNTTKAKAKILLQSIYTNMVDKSNGYQMNSWHDAEGNSSIRNPSYHMPAWDSVFQDFADSNGLSSEKWNSARSGAYSLFNAQPGASSGMARNFSTSSGGSPGGGTSSPNNYDMGFDAIRVPWRIALDAMWYRNHSAVSWCKSVWNNSIVSPDSAGLYTISTQKLYGWSDYSYEKAMSIAMWGACAVSVQDSSSAAGTAASKLLTKMNTGVIAHNYFYLSGAGVSSTADSNYYAQSLSLMGALAMDGRAWNVWDDLKHKWNAPDTLATVKTFKISSDTVVRTTGTDTIAIKLSHSIGWKLTLTGATSGLYTFTGTSDSIGIVWTPSTQQGSFNKFVDNELVTVKLTYTTTTVVPSGTTSKSIYLKAASAGILTQRSHQTALSWNTSGLRLPTGVLEIGQSYDVRVMDLMGRQQGATRSAIAHQEGTSTLLDLAPQHMDKAGFVEVRAQDGTTTQLLLPPVR
jgi:endo-1,4-beta-D-glucanase Y